MAGVAAVREHLDLFARRFALALQQGTRLRAGGEPDSGDDEALASQAHLPGVGWVLGIAACLVFALVALLLRGSAWQAAVAAVAATLVVALLTGARAETALLRAAEALSAPGQAGTGTVALVLLLAAKFALLAALASLTESGVMAALFAAHAVAQLAPLLLARSLGAATPARAVHVGALWCLPPLLLLVPAAGVASLLLALAAATLACYGVWRLARRRPDHERTDLLAATALVCELAFYFGAAIAA
jgi:adenosylcobinamide-GDP ribazoletransferase